MNPCSQIQKKPKGADWSRHIFVQSATATASDESLAVTLSSVHRGQYDTIYATIEYASRKAFTEDTMLGDGREPVRTSRLIKKKMLIWLESLGQNFLVGYSCPS